MIFKKYRTEWMLLGILLLGTVLRLVYLTEDLPYSVLGSPGALLLDEGAYQLSAAHKVLFGQWQMPGAMYAGWTVRLYQSWVWIFFKIFGVTLFAARLACIIASLLGISCLLMFLRKRLDKAVLLIFAVILSTNYLFVMWSRLALPYVATLLPVAAILVCTILAIEKKSWGYAIGAGVATFLAFAVKEVAILFVPVAVLSLVFGFYKFHRVSFWRSCVSRHIFIYLASFLILFLLYRHFYLAPHVSAFWNESARDAQSVIQEGLKGVVKPAPQSNSLYHYTMFEALQKLFLKFFGLKHIYFTWALSVIGLVLVGLRAKSSTIFQTKKSLVTLFMLLWGIIMPCGLIVLRYRSGLAFHWVTIFLVPFFYFATIGVVDLWRMERAKRVCQLLAVVLFGLSLGSDFYKYFSWIKHVPTESRLSQASLQVANTLLQDNPHPTLLMVDSSLLALRAPQVSSIYMRSFSIDHFGEIYDAWKPQYLSLLQWDNRPQEAELFLNKVRECGFTVKSLQTFPLGEVDKTTAQIAVYQLQRNFK